MGGGDKGHMLMPHIHFHHHHHHHHHQVHHHHDDRGGGVGGGRKSNIPKGYVAITVGQGAEQQRFVIPVMYVNHPLFTQLLKEAEEEYGFDQKGPINIPCHVEEFCHIRGIIDRETMSSNDHHHHHHHHHQFLCFKA